MMRFHRSLLPAACTCTVLALCSCTAASNGSRAPSVIQSTVPAPAPTSPAAGTTTCKDGQPIVASLSPGPITTNPQSWPAGSTMAKIKARGHLIVGTSGDAMLWGARNPVNGKIEGFDVDVAARLAQALGLNPDLTVYKILTIAQRIPALQDGTVDVVAERMGIICDRWQGSAKDPKAYVNLSTAYYVSGARFLVRSDSKVTSLAGLKNRTVCGVKASTSLDALVKADPENLIKKVEATEPGRCLVKFQEGEVYAVVGDDTTLSGLANQDQYARIVGARLNSSPTGFGLNSEAEDLTKFANLVLEQMRADGSLTVLYNRWMKPVLPDDPVPSVPPAVYGRRIPDLQRQS